MEFSLIFDWSIPNSSHIPNCHLAILSKCFIIFFPLSIAPIRKELDKELIELKKASEESA